MKPFHPSLVLSALETEALRDYRSRVGRLPPSDAAMAVVARGYFTVIDRVGLAPAGEGRNLTPEQIVAEAASADVAGLNSLLASLQALLQGPPAGWRKAVQAGAPQAVISRRLALAGREAPKDGAEW
ncbi:MAG TPA: hypothetical protein VEZ70_13075 [Allosphingosinicella sp.]|nr:hypothetical protein [Allosphingosinicella sp.]